MSLLDYVSSQLLALNLKTVGETQEHAEYICSVVEEEYLTEPEKREALHEYFLDLTASRRKAAMLNTHPIVDNVFRKYKSLPRTTEEPPVDKAPPPPSSMSTDAPSSPPQKRSGTTLFAKDTEPTSITARSARYQQQTKSKQERQERERLLSKYGYDVEIIEQDGEDEIVYRESSTSSSAPVVSVNRNVDVVREKEQARREAMKQKSEAEKARNKELQEKQKLEREKEKRRTQKREKRRL
ncbi:hypothetical protein BZG36_02340 [Bifiguratus adelaidae]|uniref:Coiled-coil domain-containing protein 43 n=1 Tax=Bifiguratus adelaidae TaxID=1938954 RepID=A0A261Y2H4_9FUNG|nr:hypothetical protein BZG36_02340 [Bifiguratus adelaidae]